MSLLMRKSISPVFLALKKSGCCGKKGELVMNKEICGSFIKCNNAEGCFGCEYESEDTEDTKRSEKDLHPRVEDDK